MRIGRAAGRYHQSCSSERRARPSPIFQNFSFNVFKSNFVQPPGEGSPRRERSTASMQRFTLPPSAPKPPPVGGNRRRFLQVVSVSPLLLDCAGASDVGPQSVGRVSAGLAQDLPVGSLTGVGRQPLCVGRDEAGVYAMTLICPHAGCDMSRQGSVSPQSVYCACHGSRFDRYGRVEAGPARSDLQHFEVTIDDSGELAVDSDIWVDPSTRLEV